MTYTDSHLHFDSYDEAGDLDNVVGRARDAGVRNMVAIGGTPGSNTRALSIAGRYDGIWAAVGYDRDEAGGHPDLATLGKQAISEQVVAVGETGLDYHYSGDTAAEQRKLFASMLETAADAGLPVVVHSRNADEDTLSLLREFSEHGHSECMGVLHCFTGTMAFAEALLEMGMMISFSGIITFKKADELRSIAAAVPEDRILIETDAPYLAPVPYRGKRNEPALIVHVAEELARVRHTDLPRIADVTTQNAIRLFGLE